MNIRITPNGFERSEDGNKPRKPRKPISKGKLIATNLLYTLLAGLVYYYIKLPAINLQEPAFYGFFLLLAAFYCVLAVARKFGLSSIHSVHDAVTTVKACCAVPAILCGGLVLLFIVGSLLSAPLFRARAYSQLLTTEESDFTQDIDEISFDQIPRLDKDATRVLADRKLGELSDLVSQFEVNSESYQINYNDKPVRVTYLDYGDIFKWLKNTGEGIPAYMVIDMVSQEVSVVRLPQGIRYSPSEYFFRFIDRQLRFQYPTLMFDDVNFEIDEDGQPWWVASVITKRIGLFGGVDVSGAVLLNAVTGESNYYDAADIPVWVDRAYTADIILQQYNYYGMYHNGFINSLFTQSGCTVTTSGYNYIAQSDDVWVYTGITSVGGDESNIGFILVNQRTKEAKYYSIAGATETSAMNSAQGAVQQYQYQATFPLLLNIGGQPTYFMALKDASNLVKMYAMVNVRQYQIVATGSSVADCQMSYLSQLEKNELITSEEPVVVVPETVTVRGTISELRSTVEDGWTHFYLQLTGRSDWYDLSLADVPVAAIFSIGDGVTLEVAAAENGIFPVISAERLG